MKRTMLMLLLLLSLSISSCARLPMMVRAVGYQGGVPLYTAFAPTDMTTVLSYLTEIGYPLQALNRTWLVVDSPIMAERWPPRVFRLQKQIHLHPVVGTLPRCERLGVIVHELMHRAQWEDGALTASSYTGEALGHLVNHSDTNRFEREAYAAQDLFTQTRCR